MNTSELNNKKNNIQLKEVEKERFRLFITRNVDAKIRFWCKSLPDKEWSGVLFYRTEGTFGKGDFVAKTVDFIVMDIGSSTHTQFDENPEIVSYMLDKDLMDCKLGVIHSHNVINVFFSGEDKNTILNEGIDRIHFLSLVVNNFGDRLAAITRNVKRTITVINNGYTTFDGVVVSDNKTNVVDRHTVEIVYADITTEDEYDDYVRFNELLDRNLHNERIGSKNNVFIPRINSDTINEGTSIFANNEQDEINYYYNLILTGNILCETNEKPDKSMDSLDDFQSEAYESLVYNISNSLPSNMLLSLYSRLSKINGFEYIDKACDIISSSCKE